MSVLVIDVGTSSVRAGVVVGSGVTALHRITVLPSTPAPNFVEIDAVALGRAVLEVARRAVDDAAESGDSVEAVGITNQRCSTIVWERDTGRPVGPGVGWQDLRTVAMCLALQSTGLRLAPNSSATKLVFLLDVADPERQRDLCFGTVDTWVAWLLSEGGLHVTDPSNAGVTGMMSADACGWDPAILDLLRIPASVLPTIVDSSGPIGEATALPGAPLIAGIAGDQQASLMGQGCTRPGLAKLTFGTGGMLDLYLGPERPPFEQRGDNGCFPVIAWRRNGTLSWGLEAAMLSAGQTIEWLRDDLGLIDSPEHSAEVAARCERSDDVWFVPAMMGMGTPTWDFGARGTLLGLTRGAGRPQVVRAVLEGIAHRGADLVEAAEADSGIDIGPLRVDGGMSANPVFVQALADASRRPVELSPVTEATTLGAAFLAGLAVGIWTDEEELASTWAPRQVVEPRRRPDRDRWKAACERASGWIPELSALEF